ncbi:nitrogenase stabilizing/protective protein NifW [Paracraurococcus lichenis]|uniref:Nitrogenase-stabilizing/protective protein NifW n=1 Tax=Paracraurococcus lichenis TaxID=3064888 RepID=A0ABT9E150_9PROT|nr:nitrogenase stabilizing/protective protein NifW [Paracraurococcus sp. LOR1-02]MDO9709874.1 nitrogenase stabilizing/protective protein NifW [Paracraurococcus sp. LOR1-02]
MSPILEDLGRVSAAEDFFTLLEVPFDQQVLNVARLHILRRMRDYLRGEALEGKPEEEARALVRAHLARAYADFVASSPIEQRVFKVHQDAVRPAGKAFVPLSSILEA